LHDSLCQHLAGTALLSSALLKKLQAKQDPVAPEVARICALLTTAVNETRHLSHGLYPVRSEEGGLAAALGRLAMTISALFPICCLFRASGTTNIFDETVATHLYRIAQEAVSNAIKHGEAEQVTLKLQEKGGQILLTIRDNGCGFPERLPASHGIGLRIMTRRASEIGGCLQVNRGKRSGTVVSCSIPVA